MTATREAAKETVTAAMARWAAGLEFDHMLERRISGARVVNGFLTGLV